MSQARGAIQLPQSAVDAYRRGVIAAWANAITPSIRSSIPLASSDEILDAHEHGVLPQFLLEQMRARLGMLAPELVEQVCDEVHTRTLSFLGSPTLLLLSTRQSVEWFSQCSVFNFDFVAESLFGLHDDARVILDLGGHVGVWSLYYSRVVGRRGGYVYCYEPSMLNVEAALAQFLANGLDNVLLSPRPIGPRSNLNAGPDALMVDYVTNMAGFASIEEAILLRPDFVKIDIEGFEYELITEFPQLLQMVPNVHLELHVDHLTRRGLDWRKVMAKIPFDTHSVWLYRGLEMFKLDPTAHLEGYCSIFISEEAKGDVEGSR